MLKALCLSVCILCVSFASTLDAQMAGYNHQDPGTDRSLDVSILQLITTPERFDGKKIRVVAFLRLKFEGDALYFHQEDFERSISQNAIWIDAPSNMTKAERDTVNNKYVICEGVFLARGHGHMGMFGGSINGVTRIEVWGFDHRK